MTSASFFHCSFQLHRNSVVPCTWVAATSVLQHCHRYVEPWLCPSRAQHWAAHLHRQKWAWSAVLYNGGKGSVWKSAFRNMIIHLTSEFILTVFYCLGAWNASYWWNRKIRILDCVLWWAQNTHDVIFPVVFSLCHLCWTGIGCFVLLKLVSGNTRQ